MRTGESLQRTSVQRPSWTTGPKALARGRGEPSQLADAWPAVRRGLRDGRANR